MGAEQAGHEYHISSIAAGYVVEIVEVDVVSGPLAARMW
jgi:hypothetical protein